MMMKIEEVIARHGGVNVTRRELRHVTIHFEATDVFDPVAFGVVLGTITRTEVNPDALLIDPHCEKMSSGLYRLTYSVEM
jgi:hypothetical protein